MMTGWSREHSTISNSHLRAGSEETEKQLINDLNFNINKMLKCSKLEITRREGSDILK